MDSGESRPLVVFVVGPTGTGKSASALRVAEELGGEIVSADSMQFYRGMDVGTAKPTPEERSRVRHHCIDIRDPDEPCNVAEFHAMATEAIAEIHGRGALPLVVGGSGLYVRAVANKLDLPAASPDDALRADLRQLAARDGPAALHARLARVDPASAARIHPHDVKKVIRAIEVFERTGRPMSNSYESRPEPTDRYRCLMFGLTCDRQELYRRAEERCDRMVNSGLLREVRALLDRGYSRDLQTMQSIGYQEMAAFLCGEMAFPVAVETFKRNTRRYIKRQLTWFGPDERIRWLDITTHDPVNAILRGIAEATRG